MSTPAMLTTLQRNKQIVSRWFDEVWTQGRRETIHELYGANTILHDGETTYRGPDEFSRFYDALTSQFNKFSIKPILDLAEGDLVCTHFLVECTQITTGRPVKFTAAVIVRIENRQLAEAWQNWDAAAVIRQAPGVSLA